jgi:hypothetical protein
LRAAIAIEFCLEIVFLLNFLFIGQLNRPSITPSDDLLTSNGDEFTTEQDGTLVNNISFSLINLIDSFKETYIINDNI